MISIFFIYSTIKIFEIRNPGILINKEETIWNGVHCSDDFCSRKCFALADTVRRTTSWPASITITINGRPVVIQRNSESSRPFPHRPLHIKQLCLPPPKKNQIIINASACCCSHLFVLHVVHRPTIRSFMQNILKSRIFSVDHCLQKGNMIIFELNVIYFEYFYLWNIDW